VGEVFVAFLKLGLTSFGGPIAHLGYFHRELIERRQWLDEGRYAQLIALCQLLPGPASSQLGFAMGLLRAGWPGAFAAFVAFTLPSAIALFIFALFLPSLEHGYGAAALHGLKLVAIAVVAQGVLTMAQRLTPDAVRISIAIAAALLAVIGGALPGVQLVIIAMGAVLGSLLCRTAIAREEVSFDLPFGRRLAVALLIAFSGLLMVALTFGDATSPLTSLVAGLYRAGALVFGGGHVVLPLLQQSVVEHEWMSMDRFLAGYGAAQAVPGPLFSIAAFVGAPQGPFAAVLALIAIFLPGLLLVAGCLPFWREVAGHARAMNALSGVNAAVVGLLAAALYDPLWTSTHRTIADFGIALAGLLILLRSQRSIALVIVLCVAASGLLG
jgi:chromate transporter